MKSLSGVRWLLAAMVVVGATGRAITGLAVYTRLAYAGLILLVGAYLWSLLSLRKVQLRRETRLLRLSMGEVFEEHFEIFGMSWPGTTWIEIVNRSPLPMAGGSRLLTNIGAKQKRFYSARTVLTRRGAFMKLPRWTRWLSCR
jgi:hypothetical protein